MLGLDERRSCKHTDCQAMLPIVLDSHQISVALAGSGERLERRYRLLKAAGVEDLKVFSGDGGSISGATDGLPSHADLEDVAVLFIAGLPRDDAQKLVAYARARGILVNTEDDRALCDFHVPASVRRGGLLLTVSTGGGSPGLARRLRKHLEAEFGEEWDERVSELSAERTKWREDGEDLKRVAQLSDEYVDRKGWLK